MQVTKCGEKEKDTVVNKVLLAVKVHEMTWTAPTSVPEGYEVQLVWVSVSHFTMYSQLVTYRRKKDSGNKDNFSFTSNCPASHHKTWYERPFEKGSKDQETRFRRAGQETRDVDAFNAHFLIYFTGEHDTLVPTPGPQLKWHRNMKTINDMLHF